MPGSGRNFPCWIDAFEDYTNGLPTPPLFRRWAGIAAVAGALERKVWMRSMQKELFPNFYILLVAPPGVGKTVIITEVEALWAELTDHFIAPTSMTKAGLVDTLSESKRTIVRPGQTPPIITFHSLLVPAPEFGVLVPAYDLEFMNNLNDLYDCRAQYVERIRSRPEPLKIVCPQLNILAGTQPQYLSHLLPEVAWGQGFTSRTILIYSGDNIRGSLFDERDRPDPARLILDLKHIGSAYGQVRWDADAAAAVEAWHATGGEPIPTHAKLQNYNPRRTLHLLKLSIVSACSRTNDLVVRLEDYQRALDWLTEAEGFMPDIFKAMSGGGDSAIIDDTWHYLWSMWAVSKKPISEAHIMAFIADRAPAHTVPRVLDLLVKTGKLKMEMYDGNGRAMYSPLGKQMHGV